MAYAFDDDTALEPLSGSGLSFSAGISHRWDTVGPPNGGFLLALAARGLGRTIPFPDPITLTGHFLRPARHTPVQIDVEPIRTGAAHATAMARLHQDGKEILRTLATFADLDAAFGPTQHGARPPSLPPPEECVPVEELAPRQWDDLPGRLPVLYRSIDIRVGSPERRENEIARIEGWVRFTDGRALRRLLRGGRGALGLDRPARGAVPPAGRDQGSPTCGLSRVSLTRVSPGRPGSTKRGGPWAAPIRSAPRRRRTGWARGTRSG